MAQFDSKILSSCYINFLFGAGVNGQAFPQLAKFEKTYLFMKKKHKDFDNKSFEELFDTLNKKDRERAREIFIDEFKNKHNLIDWNNESIKNLEELLSLTYKLVYEAENRIDAMNQINIFTANYDFIVEELLKKLGYLSNYVSASNLVSNDKFFNIVGHDYSLKRKVPTFLVSKIHGDISNPVLPGNDKYDAILTPNKFEIMFKMKEKLSRFNSILFVIGYSGRDEHINRILKDCVQSGLTIYWFKYSEKDYVPEELKTKTIIIDNEDKIDTTKVFSKELSLLWEKSLVK